VLNVGASEVIFGHFAHEIRKGSLAMEHGFEQGLERFLRDGHGGVSGGQDYSFARE
jgi:hypothetical protein